MQDRSRMEQRRRALGPAFVVVGDDFVVPWRCVAGDATAVCPVSSPIVTGAAGRSPPLLPDLGVGAVEALERVAGELRQQVHLCAQADVGARVVPAAAFVSARP